MNKELLRDAASVMETWWAKFPQDMSASDRAVVTRMQAEIDAPEPYDQQALELCTVCGWKALIPGDCCLNCTRVLDAPTNCTRSHPHENMSPMCELRTEIARLNFEARQPVADLTDDEIKAIVEKCADDQWPDVGYVGWSVVDTEFYARLVKAVLAAQKGKS